MISPAIAMVVLLSIACKGWLTSLSLFSGSSWVSQQGGCQGKQQQNEPLERFHSHGPKPLHAQGAAKQDPRGEGEAAGGGGGGCGADDDPLPGPALDSEFHCSVWCGAAESWSC